MKFDKFIRKTYTLLEQDQQQGTPQPNASGGADPSDVSSEVEKVGKKMGSQVETAEEELYSMSKDLIKVITQALQTDNINLNDHPNLKQIIDKLNQASGAADANTGLPAVQQVIKSYTEDITKKPQPFNF
jgi:TolA-binding protein